MTTVVLDSHVLHWWSAEPDRLSSAARQAIEGAQELAVASITWFELAWLATHGRIDVSIPVGTWLDGLSGQVRTVGTTPSIALAAVSLSGSFPGDPADRLIYATAMECGWPLVTKDHRLRAHRTARRIAIW